MGSDDTHFHVSVGIDRQSHKTVSTNHNLFEEKGEPKRYRTEVPSAYQPNALPLGQTGPQHAISFTRTPSAPRGRHVIEKRAGCAEK